MHIYNLQTKTNYIAKKDIISLLTGYQAKSIKTTSKNSCKCVAIDSKF